MKISDADLKLLELRGRQADAIGRACGNAYEALRSATPEAAQPSYEAIMAEGESWREDAAPAEAAQEHSCGKQGFNPALGDVCEACRAPATPSPDVSEQVLDTARIEEHRRSGLGANTQREESATSDQPANTCSDTPPFNMPWERIPQHRNDPGYGPVPPESNVRHINEGQPASPDEAEGLAEHLEQCAAVAKPTDDGVTYGLAGLCRQAAALLRELPKLREELNCALAVGRGLAEGRNQDNAQSQEIIQRWTDGFHEQRQRAEAAEALVASLTREINRAARIFEDSGDECMANEFRALTGSKGT